MNRFHILLEQDHIVDGLFPMLNGWSRRYDRDLAELVEGDLFQGIVAHRRQDPIHIDESLEGCHG